MLLMCLMALFVIVMQIRIAMYSSEEFQGQDTKNTNNEYVKSAAAKQQYH